MSKDIYIFIRHILESILLIEEFTSGQNKRSFMDSKMMQAAIIRQLEVIGEAAKLVPEPFRKKHPEVPWNEMARTRDKLIHGYFGVDLNLTWDIVVRDLHVVKKRIEKILEKEEK